MTDMAHPTGPASRLVSDQGLDDTVLPFAVEPLDVRGRIVRLGACAIISLSSTIIRRPSRGWSARPWR